MYRPLTSDEQQAVVGMVERAGLAGVLRFVGGLVAQQHPDAGRGVELRTLLGAVAQELSATPEATGEPVADWTPADEEGLQDAIRAAMDAYRPGAGER